MLSSDSDSDLEILNILSSDSDSDESYTFRKPKKTRIDYISILDSNDFQLKFRLDKETVEEVLLEIQPLLPVSGPRNHGISPLHQLLLTLRFYAVGTMLVSVADFIGVSKTSACRIVRDVSCTISSLYDKYVYMHANTENEFYNIARFPHVLGVIDCTHVKVQSCPGIGEEFKNRNGYSSLNIQAVCNADLQFMNVVARWPGSTEDAAIFDKSELRAQCEIGAFGNKWLLADNAYPLKPYLLTPVPNPISHGEQLYNEAHYHTRNTIDRCFSLWRRRFPVVALTLRLSLMKAHAVIIATTVLHNICLLRNLEDIPPEVDVPEVDNIHIPYDDEFNNTIERHTLITEYFNHLE